MEYSYLKTLEKGAKYVLISLFASLPFLAQLIPPEIQGMNVLEFLALMFPYLKIITLGAIIQMVINFLKNKFKIDLL